MSLLLILPLFPSVGAVSPSACFTVDPPAGSTVRTFTFDSSCSTHPSTPTALLEVRWDWEDGSGWDTTFSTTKVAQHRFTTPGVKVVRVEVRDPVSGDTSTTSMRITVTLPNYRPMVGAVTIVKSEVGAPLVRTSLEWHGFTCSTAWTSAGVNVRCVAPPPGAGYDGWSCSGVAVGASATDVGGSVRGTVDCPYASGPAAPTSTGDAHWPSPRQSAHTPLIEGAIAFECRAGPTALMASAVPPYTVACGDP